MRKDPFIVANWKMNGVSSSLIEISSILDFCVKNYGNNHAENSLEIAFSLPFTLLYQLQQHFQQWKKNQNISYDSKKLILKSAAQNCHQLANGAFTGEISAPMLADIGVDYVILGHSERRSYFSETSHLIAQKASSVIQQRMIPIICIGESLEIKKSGKISDFIKQQLFDSLPREGENLIPIRGIEMVIAYEPIWAIGTGLIPTASEISQMFRYIRLLLCEYYNEDFAKQVRLLYGGSVKAENIAQINGINGVDGFLVGGASLLAKDFNPIIEEIIFKKTQ